MSPRCLTLLATTCPGGTAAGAASFATRRGCSGGECLGVENVDDFGEVSPDICNSQLEPKPRATAASIVPTRAATPKSAALVAAQHRVFRGVYITKTLVYF